MSRLLALLPPWAPFAAVGALLLALAGGVLALRAAWQEEGAARVVAADQKAALEQQARDAKLSADLIANQAAEIAALQAKAGAIIGRIDHAPQTMGCGPVMRDASRGLRELFGKPAAPPPAGRQPAAAVR